MKEIIFRDLGLMDYQSVWDYQEELFKATITQKITNRDSNSGDRSKTLNYLLFCEHPHVYTLGKSGLEKHLLVNNEILKKDEISFFKTNRGGDITYHGPGQIVGYPILDLDNFFTDVGKYMRLLEETIIVTLSDYGIHAGRLKGSTGVWIDEDSPVNARKICALGVRLSHWVTMHGFAFNVNTGLKYFDYIIPCGITDKQVTSMEKELGRKVKIEEVKEKLKINFSKLFEAKIITEYVSAENISL